MVEKVGLAIGQASKDAEEKFYIIKRFKDKYDVMEVYPPRHADYCHLNLGSLEEAKKIWGNLILNYAAKAAIAAMREPTDKMLYTPSQWFSKTDPFGLVHYQSMIDAALKDE